MKFCWVFLLLFGISHAQPTQPDPRRSGNAFLSPALQQLSNDAAKNPAQLWVERGEELWAQHCQHCHSDLSKNKSAAATHPKLSAKGELLNLEDQIQRCGQRPESRIHSRMDAGLQPESTEILSLSAALHQVAKGERINIHANAKQVPLWQSRYANGERLYNTRMGRINLACVHCHDQRVGAQMRADVVSEAHPTGFPIYRMSWQTLGSVERRLRACYSGVQAMIPPAGAAELRDLELFLKVRANGMVLDGVSVRR